jgi:hypothetical protein
MAKKPRGPTRVVLLYPIHRQYPSLCGLLFCEACEMPPVGQAPHLVYLYKALELGFRNFRCEWQSETYEYFTCYAFFLQNSSCITLPMLKGSITLGDLIGISVTTLAQNCRVIWGPPQPQLPTPVWHRRILHNLLKAGTFCWDRTQAVN